MFTKDWIYKVTKGQKSMSIPREYFQELEKFFEDIRDVCEEIEISSVSELLRVLAKLGKPRFLEIVEQVRRGRKLTEQSQ